VDHVESNSIPSYPLRNLLGIEFSAIVGGSSLEADSRAFWRILYDSMFPSSECPEFYDEFYVESAWSLHAINIPKKPEFRQLRARGAVRINATK
jgi:hypothetical protein